MNKKDENGIANNIVNLSGVISGKFEFSHDIYGEGFYQAYVECVRGSGTIDVIPIVVSSKLVDITIDRSGMYAIIGGQYRSYNRHNEDGTNNLILFVFVQEIEFTEVPEKRRDRNDIRLDGYLCKNAIYRKTPLGSHIADMLFAINRVHGKSDYIPCICWGRDAMFAANIKVGTNVTMHGRIQSRLYKKRINEDEFEDRIAYEVSLFDYSEVV